MSDSNLCASSDVGDTCAGDSGGGLVTFNREGSFEVIGIISFGIGCNSTIDGKKILIIAIEIYLNISGEKLPGVYSRISESLDWIQEVISDGKC